MTSYNVRLPVFEGPLDALLALIERHQLDITSVSLATVADQFLDHVRGLEIVDAPTLAQFVSVSARLLLLKSRALLPASPRAADQPDEVEALVDQLREYRRFKQAAALLQQREEAGIRTYLRPPLAAALRTRISQPVKSGEPVSVLLDALRRTLATRTSPPPLPEPVQPQKVTLAERIAVIEQLLASGQPIRLSDILAQTSSRVAQVVTFLALLELMKQSQVEIIQEQPFAEVLLQPISATKVRKTEL